MDYSLKQIAILLLLLAALVFLAFWSGVSGEFLVWDDLENAAENENIHSLDLQTLEWAATNAHLGVWEPLSFILKAAIADFFGVKPAPFKIVSIVLHFINLILMALVILKVFSIRQLVEKSNELAIWSAFIGVVLFGISPMRVAAVSWVSCQPYLLCAMFCLLTVIFYLQYVSRKTRIHLWLSLLFYIFAAMSKAVAMTLPIALLIIDIYLLKRLSARPIKVFLEKVPFFMVSFFTAYSAFWARSMFTSFEPTQRYSILHRFMIASYGFIFYIRRSIIPFDFAPFYPLPGSKYLPNADYSAFFTAPFILSAIAFVILVVILALRRRFGTIVASLAIYFIILLPNIGLLIAGVNLVADRYAYIAMIPLYAALSGGILSLVKALPKIQSIRKYGATGLFIIIVIINIVSCWRVIDYWRNDENFWQRMIMKYPQSPHGYYILGSHKAAEGYKKRNKRYMLIAEQYLDYAIKEGISDEKALYKMAFVQNEIGRWESAKKYMSKYLAKNPYDPLALYKMAEIEQNLGNIDGALENYHTILAVDRSFAMNHNILDKLRRLEIIRAQRNDSLSGID